MSRKYIFTKRDNTKKGIMSTVLGIISIITLVLIVYFSFLQSGEVPESYAASMFVVTLFSLTGIGLGAVGMFEKEKFRLFPGLGIFLNVMALAFIGFIIYTGGTT